MKKYLLVVATIAVLAGAYLVLKPKSEPQPTIPITAVKAPKAFALVVKNRKLVVGAKTIKVTQGDEVVITIAVDENEELHLHGYDKSVEIEKGTPAELTFTADKAGRFEYELEESGTELGALEVQPK